MAGFAVDAGVFTGGLGGDDVGMANFAGLVAGVLDRAVGQVLQSGAAIVPVLAEAFGRNDGAKHEDGSCAYDEEGCESEQMSCVLKDSH